MLAWRCVVRTNLSAEMRSCQHCMDLQSTGANVTLSAACLVLLAVSAGASSSWGPHGAFKPDKSNDIGCNRGQITVMSRCGAPWQEGAKHMCSIMHNASALIQGVCCCFPEKSMRVCVHTHRA